MIDFVRRRIVGMLRGTDRIVEVLEDLSVLGAILLVTGSLVFATSRIDPIDLGWLAAETFTLAAGG